MGFVLFNLVFLHSYPNVDGIGKLVFYEEEYELRISAVSLGGGCVLTGRAFHFSQYIITLKVIFCNCNMSD